MNTEKHVVTIPIADYNKLLKAEELVGVNKLAHDTPMWREIDAAMRSLSINRGGADAGIPKNIELYFKAI